MGKRRVFDFLPLVAVADTEEKLIGNRFFDYVLGRGTVFACKNRLQVTHRSKKSTTEVVLLLLGAGGG